MNPHRGTAFALSSVLLVSAAQLGMRWSMERLPRPEHWLPLDGIDFRALAIVAAAIFAYVLSLLSWFAALRGLPLGRAYSLLSISYALVYLLAATLPQFNETFSLAKSLGVALIILGVITITARPARATKIRNNL